MGCRRHHRDGGSVEQRSRRRQHLAACLLLFVTIPLTRSASSGPSQTPGITSAPPAQPGISLFHQGEDALSWDSDELTRVRTLRSPDAMDLQSLLKAGSVGEYLGLGRVDALHLPVPLNIVFVGFAGDGNMHINIGLEQLQHWFGHLDHVLPHTRVELSELKCAEDGHCAGLVHGHARPEPVPSYVHLNFTCNVVVTRSSTLSATFERALHVFSRPVDPAIEMGAQQVDAHRMETFIDNFLQALGILDNAYTLLVLNPTWSVTEPVYGYRLGLSQAELDVVLANTNKVKQLLQLAQGTVEPPMPAALHQQQQQQAGWFSRHVSGQTRKFSALDLSAQTNAWVQRMSPYLAQVEDHRKAMLKVVGTMPGAAAMAQALTLLKRTDSPIHPVLVEEIMSTDPFASVYSKFRTMHPAEDCMVGNWVGHQRWVLVDLTAGGFDWGPALGGEGVVHKHSLPSVTDHFSALHQLRERHLEEQQSQAERQLSQQLEAETASHKSKSANTAYQAFAAEMSAQQRGRAPGEPPEPDGGHKQREQKSNEWRLRYQESLLKAELEMAEQYASRYCSNPTVRPVSFCTRLKDQASKARTSLAKLAGAQATSVDVWRDVRWDLFGSSHSLESLNGYVADEAQRSRDLFLADLNGVLSRALRHVVAPPTATWTHAGGFLHDTATPFVKHVVFSIFVIQDNSHAAAGLAGRPPQFDLATFQAEVGRLAIKGQQQFDFHVHQMSLGDDGLLSTSFASAQRSSAHEVPTEVDAVHEVERMWIDTRVLAYGLRQRFTGQGVATNEGRSQFMQELLDQWPLGTSSSSSSSVYRTSAESHTHPTQEGSKHHSTYNVPVFVFEIHRDYAVLLDEHYNAKALEDMIMVVVNAARDDEHPTGMMCGGALMARPLSPLREALGAALEHLSGVLPPHLGYSPGTGKVHHDWLWSVGSHPLSHTSVGTSFTEMQRDALARSYLLDALDSSVDLVNAAVAALGQVAPSQAAFEHLKAHKDGVEDLARLWGELIGLWRAMVQGAMLLNWGVAVAYLSSVEDKSLEFRHLAERLADVPPGSQCAGVVKPSSSDGLVLPTLVISVVVASSALLYLAWPMVAGMLPGRGGRPSRRKGSKWAGGLSYD